MPRDIEKGIDLPSRTGAVDRDSIDLSAFPVEPWEWDDANEVSEPDLTLVDPWDLVLEGSLTVGDNLVLPGVYFYEPTGSDDDTALDTLFATYSDIVLLPGSASFTTNLDIPTGCTLRSLGRSAAVVSGKGITLSGAEANIIGVGFSDVDGDDVVTVDAYRCMVRDCIFTSCNNAVRSGTDTWTCINVTSNSDGAMILDNYAEDNGNLIDRGDCESTTAPMVEGESTPNTTNIGTYEQSSTQAHGGSNSYKIVGDGVGVAFAEVCNSTSGDLHGLVPGKTYNFRAYVYVPSGGYTVGNITLRFGDDSGGSSDSPAVSAADTWELLEVEHTIASDAADTYIGLRIDETGTDTVYWDDIQLLPLGIHNEHDQQFIDNGTGTIV